MEKNAPCWKRAAKCFLLYFYDNYLQKTTKFPASFFSASNATEFGRQDLLAAFIEENQDLGVCVFCDQSRHYTQDKQGIHTSLDHYLPKAQYPHLACHPYNLIPVCHFCNSSVKGESDPSVDVRGKRRTLSKYSLPYRSEGRGHDSYLEVGLSSTKPFEVKAIRPRKDNTGYIDLDLCQAIEVLAQIHNIPGRWAVPTETNKISETLFRRMRQFFFNGQCIPSSFDISPAITHSVLKQLLYYMNEEDRRRDPFAFAMTWMLVALINEDLQPFIEEKATYSAILEEIVSWFEQSLANTTKLTQVADNLLAIPLK